MSMTGQFAAISKAKLDELQDDPDSVADFLFLEADEGGPRHTADIDKAWHGIHFLLTGSPSGGVGPLAAAIMGGEEIGDEEGYGYGAIRYLEGDEVQAIAHALSDTPTEELAKRYSVKALTAADIYPGIWEDEGDRAFDYLAGFYEDMVEFYQDAAKRGDVVLLYLA